MLLPATTPGLLCEPCASARAIRCLQAGLGLISRGGAGHAGVVNSGKPLRALRLCESQESYISRKGAKDAKDDFCVVARLNTRVTLRALRPCENNRCLQAGLGLISRGGAGHAEGFLVLIPETLCELCAFARVKNHLSLAKAPRTPRKIFVLLPATTPGLLCEPCASARAIRCLQAGLGLISRGGAGHAGVVNSGKPLRALRLCESQESYISRKGAKDAKGDFCVVARRNIRPVLRLRERSSTHTANCSIRRSAFSRP